MDQMRHLSYHRRVNANRVLLACCAFICLMSLFVLAERAHSEGMPASSSSWFIDMNRFAQSAHAALTCQRCHGTMMEGMRPHPDRQDSASLKADPMKTYDYGRCAACHQQAYDRYLRGEHAKAMIRQKEPKTVEEQQAALARPAPTCGDCHSSHYVKAHLSRVEIGVQMTETCGSCHPAQRASYLADIHGRTGVYLGKPAAAYCTDCHGAHNCVSLKNKEEALPVCQRCHKGATAGFTSVVIHAGQPVMTKQSAEKQRSTAIIQIVGRIVKIAVILVIAFFVLHTFVWILREVHRKLREY